MEKKINFYQPKNQFPRAEIRFLLKRLLPPNFKIFKRALNKTILFLLDRKFVSTSRNEKRFTWEKPFSLPGISDKWKKPFFTSQKKFLLGAMKFFCKNWFPHNFNKDYHQEKEYYNNKEYYFTWTEKDFTAFVSASENYYGFQSFLSACGKHYLNQAESNFLKKFLLRKDYSCKWTTDFLASGSHSFSIFSEIPTSDSFFLCLVETNFLASENCFLLFRGFFLLVETITETSGNQF